MSLQAASTAHSRPLADLQARIDAKRAARDAAPPRAARPCPPALTGGGKTEQAKVDWCTLTWKPEADEHVGRTAHDWFTQWLGAVAGESVNGMFGYETGVRFYVVQGGTSKSAKPDDGSQEVQPVYVGRVDYGGEHHKGRARLDLTGTGCSKVRSWMETRAVLEGLAEAQLTRVDLAVDLLEGEFSVEDALMWWQDGEFQAATSGTRPRHSMVGDWGSDMPKHGRTLEVGRRENGKMCRVYEKGRQLGQADSPWTRFEVELRNNERDLPFEMLTDSAKYFAGAYKCLEQLLDAAAERIKLHEKEGEISLKVMTGHAKNGYGKVVHVLRGFFTAEEVLKAITRPGIPKRLERASLGGFLNGSPPDLLQ